MQAITGAILILSGSVLISAGIVATTGNAEVGFVLGGIVFVSGMAVLLIGPAKRVWDAIPTEQLNPPADTQNGNED